MTSKSLQNYYRDEGNDDVNENNTAGNYKINNKTTTSTSFEYQTKITGSTPAGNSRLDTEVVVLLKHLTNFWILLDFPLIHYETELDLT